MSYTKRTDIPADIGETVVEMGTGDLVAVRCDMLRCTESQCQTYAVAARWIDETGQTKTDAQGHAVVTSHRHVSSDAERAANGTTLLTACLMLILGEPVPTMSDGNGDTLTIFSAEVVENCSIVRAIAAAKATLSAVDVGAAL